MKILFWLLFVVNIVFAGVSGYNQCMASDSESAGTLAVKPLNANSIRIIKADAPAEETADKPVDKQADKAPAASKPAVKAKKKH